MSPFRGHVLIYYLILERMPFKPLGAKAAMANTIPLLVEASATITKGDAVEFDGGYAQPCTSSSTEVRYVAAETVDNSAGSDGDKTVRCYDARGMRFECETNSTAAQTMVGTLIDLTDANTLNEAASTTDVFFVDTFVDTGTLQGYFPL